MSKPTYYESFKNNADVLQYAGGMLGQESGLIDAELDTIGVKLDDTKQMLMLGIFVISMDPVIAIVIHEGSYKNQDQFR